MIEGRAILVNPYEKHQYRNWSDKALKMISGVAKESE